MLKRPYKPSISILAFNEARDQAATLAQVLEDEATMHIERLFFETCGKSLYHFETAGWPMGKVPVIVHDLPDSVEREIKRLRPNVVLVVATSACVREPAVRSRIVKILAETCDQGKRTCLLMETLDTVMDPKLQQIRHRLHLVVHKSDDTRILGTSDVFSRAEILTIPSGDLTEAGAREIGKRIFNQLLTVYASHLEHDRTENSQTGWRNPDWNE